MTLQPTANRDDVLFRGGFIGGDATFYGTFPDDASSETSGNGTVNTGEMWTEVTAPGAGDNAEVRYGSDRFVRQQEAEIIIAGSVWGLDETDQTGRMWVGFEGQAEIDMVTGDVKLDHVIRDTITDAPHNATTGFIVRARADDTRTEVTYTGKDFASQTYTYDDGTDGVGGRVYVESEGVETEIYLTYMRQQLAPGDSTNPFDDGEVTNL